MANTWNIAFVLTWTFFLVAEQSGNFPMTANAPGIQEIMVPMCKNFVPYSTTMLPNQMGDNTQVDVYWSIQNMWVYMDYGCSANFRLFVCSYYLPRYNTATNSTEGPCKETCNKARKLCKKPMKSTKSRWPREYKCNRFPSKRNDKTCIPPVKERRLIEHTYCTENTIPLCQNLPINLGSLPNLFLQRNVTEITVELDFYQPLIDTECNANIRFFLCGLHFPFCLRQRGLPFTIPCRELCEEVQNDCQSHFNLLYGGLPWPSKLQCHRFSSSEGTRPCAMPGDFQVAN